MQHPITTLEDQRLAQKTALEPLMQTLKAQQDETQRLRHQLNASQQVQAQLIHLLDTVEDFVCSTAIDPPTLLYCNLAAERVYGRSEAEFLHYPHLWLEVVHPEDYARVHAADQALLSQKSYNLDYRIIRPDGEVCWVRDRAQLIQDVDQTPIRIDRVVSLIPPPTLPNLALQLESSPWLEATILHTHDMVLVARAPSLTDPELRIIFVNASFSSLMGYPPEDVLGQTPQMLYGSQTDREQQARIQRSLQLQELLQTDLILYSRDQTERWISLTLVPILNLEGILSHWLFVLQDISESKRIETEVLRALVKERELNDLKSRFISMASHEFRTPLTTIQSSADLLEHFTFDPEERQDLFAQIKGAVKNLVALLEDVLFVSSVDVKKNQFAAAEFDVVKFCQTLMTEIATTAGRHHRLRFIYQGDRCHGYLNETLLRQILNNLLSNAIKYSPVGSEIEVRLSYEADTAIFQITDQGIGIPPDDQQQLFEYFHRASNVGTIIGTGLGLTIVKKCVDVCGGEIAVESAVDMGTTFTVCLPLEAFDRPSSPSPTATVDAR